MELRELCPRWEIPAKAEGVTPKEALNLKTHDPRRSTLGQSASLHLNDLGGCSGSRVITYEWTGGNANDMWRFRQQ